MKGQHAAARRPRLTLRGRIRARRDPFPELAEVVPETPAEIVDVYCVYCFGPRCRRCQGCSCRFPFRCECTELTPVGGAL